MSPYCISLPSLCSGLGADAVHACKILVIDDQEHNVQLLEEILTEAGFNNLTSTTEAGKAASLFADFQPDLVLTDWRMPGLDGCAVINQLRSLTGSDEYLPIVVLTADVAIETKMRALAAGATDFLTKPFDPIEVLLRITNLLNARRSHLIIQMQNATLEESVRRRTIDLERALTDLQHSQQKVIQQERLAALGAMAGGIAHDFNNALSIITAFGKRLLRHVEDGLTKEKATLPITTILAAAEDAAKIVHRLREFYPVDGKSRQHLPVDLNKLIEQTISLTQPRCQTEAAAGPITIATELGEIPCIPGDAAELREVLTNLIFNAIDALPQGGTISLHTHWEGDSVVLKVNDTGTGMSKEVCARCFEPFFSTKGECGSGLGLSTVFGLIQRHGGTIDIESEVGKGTTFVLRLRSASAKD